MHATDVKKIRSRPRTAGLFGAIVASVLCASAPSPAHAAPRPNWPQAAYSFDAPTDLYLSDDPQGCLGHSAQRRKQGAHVLAITLFPDAYCALMNAAACTYVFDADVGTRLGAASDHHIKSAFRAEWSDACTDATGAWAEVTAGRITLSAASDLGVEGIYDLTLADGTRFSGSFTGDSCTGPAPYGSFTCQG
jgi:hypothetical protein